MNTITFCDYLYKSLQIPVYLYDHKQLLYSFPEQNRYTLPTENYLNQLWSDSGSLCYCITNFYSYYGCILISESEESIVLGPVNYLPYSDALLHQMHKEFRVNPNETSEFNKFFCNIPMMNAETFFHTLNFIHYALTGITENFHHVPAMSTAAQTQESINKAYYSDSYIFNDSNIHNNSLEIEKNLFPLIEQGAVNELRQYLSMALPPNLGIIAKDNLRQTKNTFIVTITLASRAAIRGGMVPSHAYRLSDTYIQQMENISDLSAIGRLTYHALIDFAQKTHDNGLPLKNTAKDMNQVINYVHDHLNEPISVESIAAALGYNRSYLSRRFKQELGFDLRAFIIRCKLETSKYLLTYSHRSLSDISIYLCFSSQSHFQNAFKKQFGLTPMQYRNQTSHE
ncbi:MAG: AraC family transcriptional regulator [Lachnospiraceae bacterium]|nr:AraC family transcriptional regulator [Lachnospiraceae bacterium]